MTVSEVRQKYLDFMKSKGHAIVPSTSLVPENDPTTLFTGSGMQPMIPYLLGETHPLGTRIADSQRSFRTEDIEEVGDNRHTTFFEMLGNWSFGDYWKEEQLSWIYEFLIEEVGIDRNKFWVTCFEGDEKLGLPKDTETPEIWEKLGVPKERILFYPAKKNWWSRVGGNPDMMPVGEPGGPDTEMFYEFSNIKHDSKFGEFCHPNCDCGRFMEIGNNVFMTYKKTGEGKFELLPRMNVDFGGGLERITSAANNEPDVFRLDIFDLLRKRLEEISGKSYGGLTFAKVKPPETRSFRIVLDHVQAAQALIEDGVMPSNTEQGYVLRRLLRRAIVHADKLGIPSGSLFENKISNDEEDKFRKTLERGIREIERGEKDIFKLITSYGLPVEVLKEFMEVDEDTLKKQLESHQKISRAGSEQKFKGGLADTSDMSVKYHTATHLLHQALRNVLGGHVSQKGSNITPERLRFDFSHIQKMTDEEKRKVEDVVNEQIERALPVTYSDISPEEAQKMGALGLFEEKYGSKVRVYKVGNFSLEFCGGPHVRNTNELSIGEKRFHIIKEEAVSAGVRRIKAVLE